MKISDSLRSMRILFLLTACAATAAWGQQPAPPTPQTAPAATNPAAATNPQPAPAQPPAASATEPTQLPNAPTMSPGEAYLYAMQPFNQARSAPNDLSEADEWALGIGVARAKEQCEALGKVKFAGED
ncbi:MAG: hypothetical protein WA414_10710, partial [Acidobacteriaceae bacterium]